MTPIEFEEGVCFACKAATERRVIFGDVSPPVSINVCAECDEDGTLKQEIEKQFVSLAAGPLRAVVDQNSIADLVKTLEAMAISEARPT